MTIYGYILIMVTMLPSGDIESQALDWFPTPYECVEEGYSQENDASYGVGFVWFWIVFWASARKAMQNHMEITPKIRF